MTPEEHGQRVYALFDAALQRTPAERRQYLMEVCADDSALQAEIEELLAHDAQATNDDFLATPVLVPEGANILPAEPAESVVRYCLERLHDKGGVGEVYAAWDEQLQRPIALKCVQRQHAENSQSMHRFRMEAEVTASLEHPGIVPVHSVAHFSDGRLCYAMRLIQGETLKEASRRFHDADQRRRDPGERAVAFRQLLSRFIAVCNTVAYAHSQGILHRDLKPDNIMLGHYGETLVLDWGLAKRFRQEEGDAGTSAESQPAAPQRESGTEVGRAMGTPAYMSPEQAAGRWDVVGLASDIYSLGATLYVLLTGAAPFRGSAADEILPRVQQGVFPSPMERGGKQGDGRSRASEKQSPGAAKRWLNGLGAFF